MKKNNFLSFISTEAIRFLLAKPVWEQWALSSYDQPGLILDPEDPSTLERAFDYEVPYANMNWINYIIKNFDEKNKNSLYRRLKEGSLAQSLPAALRILEKVSKLTSPYMNLYLTRRIVSRLLSNGVTFVHLAPPSTGASEESVAGLISQAFNEAVHTYTPERDKRVLVVVEEAHNMAPAKGDAPTKPELLRIAREGRKWGLGLVLVTQRPGFVDSDILSQAASLVALRITNPDDISSIKSSVESVTIGSISMLPDLSPGQAIVSGPILVERRIPLLASVVRLGNKC